MSAKVVRTEFKEFVKAARKSRQEVVASVDRKGETWKNELYTNTDTKVYKKDELFAIGMPCGGIAAGHVLVRGDGTLARFFSNIGNDNQDITSKWNSPVPEYQRKGQYPYGYTSAKPEANIMQGFVVSCRKQEDYRSVCLPLCEDGFSNIEFIGKYPIANIEYKGAREPNFALDIKAEVFSPFIPNDLRNSANPCTIYRFTVTNNTNRAVTAQLGTYLENATCFDYPANAKGVRVNKCVDGKGFSAVQMQTIGSDKSFDVSQNSFGDMAVAVIGETGFSAAAILNAKDEVDESNFALIRHMENNLRAKKKLGVIEHEYHISQRKNGFVAQDFILKQGETKTVSFVYAWYFPNYQNNWPNAERNVGRMYTNWYNSSVDVCEYIANNLEELYSKTKKFVDTYYSGTLPAWFLERCMASASTMAAHPLEWWKDGSIHAMEGVGFCFGTPSHVWQYIQATAYLFPEIEMNFREKRDIDVCLKANGRLNFREVNDTIVDEHDLENGLKQWYYAADGQCGTILRFYREHLLCENSGFLKKNWCSIKKMIDYMVYQDSLDGKIDGIITAPQHNTSDAFLVGANTFTGSLYLAVLRAGEEMSKIVGDLENAKYYRTLFQKGKKYSEENLFNGEYFIGLHSEEDEKAWNAIYYDNGCHIDQLHGQTWAFFLGLGYLYDEKFVKTALKNLFKYNFTPDQKLICEQLERSDVLGSQANAGDGGLLTITYPKPLLKGQTAPNYWYAEYTWTGFEYHAANAMISAGLVDEGLTVYGAIRDRYDGKTHNPFNEIEGGDHYVRAMAAFGGMLAVSGFYYNGTKSEIGFAPKMQKQNFECFFSTGNSYGTFAQKNVEHETHISLKIVSGQTKLKTIYISAETLPTTIIARAGAKHLDVKFSSSPSETDKNRVALEFSEPIIENDINIKLI